MNRRRFLTITAGLMPLAALPAHATWTAAPGLSIWRGIAIGAGATIAIAGPDANAHLAAAKAEIARLERVFSLHDPESELVRLNRKGRLSSPSLDLIECLTLAGRVHEASAGAFDPTVQPLWQCYAAAYGADGRAPTPAALAAARARSGWHRVGIAPAAISLASGAALTLNGIAQGFIADRVVGLLQGRGLGDVFVDTGELRGLGQRAPGQDWRAALPGGGYAELRGRAVATSAPLGTTFDPAETVGHILDPRTGRPAPVIWKSVSISAPLAAVADGLSTAACLMTDIPTIRKAVARIPGARLEEALSS